MIKSDNKSGFISRGVRLALTMLLVFLCMSMFSPINVSAEDEWVHYAGTAKSSGVNVRTGPGTEYDRLFDESKEAVQLVAKLELVVLEDAVDSTGVKWYKISFAKDGKEYEGYVRNDFVNKDSNPITPSPIPTPTATPKPTPTLVEIATATPPPTRSLFNLNNNDESEGNSASTIKKAIIIVVIIAVLFIAGFVFLSIKQKNRRNTVHSSRKVDRIRKYEQEGNGNANGGRRRPEIRRSEEDESYVSPARKEVYYTNEMNDEEDILASLSKETDTKKALKVAIDRLQEHDIITHVVYGEGEVYDNSDVKLIEVRFGNDVRFLNKESLVNKELIEINDDEEELTVAKRRNRRRKKND